jgi:hypothetical protein
MNNANRNLILAAAAALTLSAAPSALADVRIHVNLPLPPSPHEVLRHLPVPPVPLVNVRHDVHNGHDGRWNYENRYRDDRYGNGGYRHNAYRYDSRYRNRDLWVFVEGRWIARPYRGAVWVSSTYDPWGRWIPGYWTRARYR